MIGYLEHITTYFESILGGLIHLAGYCTVICYTDHKSQLGFTIELLGLIYVTNLSLIIDLKEFSELPGPK